MCDKISVITPTFNDGESISETIQSVINQTYDNWEWIVVNDGSTDNTENIIQELIEKYNISEKSKYIYQENADQLNAIINSLNYVTGDYIFVLHSDDLLPTDHFFEKCVKIMKSNPEIDGILGDLILVDEKSDEKGIQKVRKYRRNQNEIARVMLWLGRNTYSDIAFHKRDAYMYSVKENYLTWNMPLWLKMTDREVDMLNYMSVDFPVLKYRVHQGNYINNKLGKMNVINGELRTATELMKFYDVPSYKTQYFLFRMLNKLVPDYDYRVRYKNCESKNKYKIISFIIKKRYPQGVEDNIFLTSVLGFYESNSDRILKLPKLSENLKVYYGKDVRFFNKALLSGTIDEFYLYFMKEMKIGFSEIIVHDKEDIAKVKDIIKFMCIGSVLVKY